MIQQFIILENLYEHIWLGHHSFQRVYHFKHAHRNDVNYFHSFGKALNLGESTHWNRLRGVVFKNVGGGKGEIEQGRTGEDGKGRVWAKQLRRK